MKRKFYIGLTVIAVLLLLGSVWVRSSHIALAVDNNFADGITVDSTGDGADVNTADSICDDGSGNCTLRAAIQESNEEAGTQTIKFNITGTADFTNGGQNGYTIQPTTALPELTDTVIIDGYTQPGSQANTAVAPNPLNGRLLVEISGDNAGASNGFQFTGNGNNSAIKGLVINGWSQGDALQLLADDIKVQGNYIGTNPAGTIAHPNTVGVNAQTQSPDSGHDALIGGLSPADRNLISGNTSGPTATASYPGTGWVVQGNYVGVAADGLTPVANSTPGGSGALSIDDCQDVIIGGSQRGAINVIGESLGHGIAPETATNLYIEGNYIGLGYDRTTILGNSTISASGAGFAISNVSNSIIKNNHVAGWGKDGIAINGGNSSITIESNVVHDNRKQGIGIRGTNIIAKSNVAYDNTSGNILVIGISAYGLVTDKVTVIANKVGIKENGTPAPNNPVGITVFGDPQDIIIGGTNPGEGNTIRASSDSGISVLALTASAYNATISPSGVSILKNSIADSSPGPHAVGLGIDLHTGIDTDAPPDGTPNTFTDIGPTLNDSGDTDAGPNGYLNFPVISSTAASAGKLDVTYSLDVDNSASGYRVEFFASPTADPSGYGEGQIYLGSTDTSGSVSNATASLSIPSSFSSGQYAISATTTEKDTSTDGFGSTSEFSAVLGEQTVLAAGASTTDSTNSPGLANTGQNNVQLLAAAGVTVLGGGCMLVIVRRRAKASRK